MEDHTSSVAAHYGRDDLTARILDALERDGKDLAQITIKDLSPVDEVHTRGRAATAELAALVEITPDFHVLDAGSGVGGPARYLASTTGCRVSGIDLTPGFVAAAVRLNELTELTGQVDFQVGSALELPFADDSFDLAWTVQIQMNIADKEGFYGEIFRTLKPGAQFIFQDVVQGPGGEIHLPTPWASEPGQSFLASPEALRSIVEGAGFEPVLWRDVSDTHRQWYDSLPSPDPAKPMPALGLHLVLGETAGAKRRNTKKNLFEDRIGFVQAVFRKPA
jgi:SAM-dependent methyltransferase